MFRHDPDLASQVLVSLAISFLGLIAVLVVVWNSRASNWALESTAETVAAASQVNVPDAQASLKNLQKDAERADDIQVKINHMWKQLVSNAREGFYKYERGNPYWDNSVTFTLENEASLNKFTRDVDLTAWCRKTRMRGLTIMIRRR
eukprot:756758-Hanusia_phi.AAC.9